MNYILNIGFFLLGMCAGAIVIEKIDKEIFESYRDLIHELRLKIKLLERNL